ncbi:hypothetical protein FJT64_014907 [Amphibalanus amphitrite]|uniref:Uncharacterized protein n=1 Tax=Amphibalanus amphitrite TaxID=1232801 RepID=A0A6A4X4L0_AMPAM|nr:hypothetical protein FJT64_014907 [Amphibalanus amphitrite]
MVDEHILRVIRSAETSSTPYTDATQCSAELSEVVPASSMPRHSRFPGGLPRRRHRRVVGRTQYHRLIAPSGPPCVCLSAPIS